MADGPRDEHDVSGSALKVWSPLHGVGVAEEPLGDARADRDVRRFADDGVQAGFGPGKRNAHDELLHSLRAKPRRSGGTSFTSRLVSRHHVVLVIHATRRSGRRETPARTSRPPTRTSIPRRPSTSTRPWARPSPPPPTCGKSGSSTCPSGQPPRAGRESSPGAHRRAVWAHAQSANHAALEFLQGTGISRF